ncbi:MAG: radical SAM protein [Syntrophomonadaceae bacterium]|nr:radical SAM protein [Syntrophomonadaceae bacterium]
MIVYSASQANVLPLTSRCNLRCRFCSHQGNPPDFKLPFLSDRPLKELEVLAGYLDPRRKVVIGESATKIPEGEPLLYPQLVPLLCHLRRRFPRMSVQITTNCIELTEELASVMADLQPLELVVSLNSATPEGRRRLMGDPRPLRAINGVERLGRWGVPFHGSIVLMPQLVGWDDIEYTIGFLEGQGCRMVRLLMPGFTDWGHSRGQPAEFSLGDWYKLAPRLEELRSRFDLPIIMEPPIWPSPTQPGAMLAGLVEGVIRGSDAERAGLREGDVILQVNGERVFSRVDAFERIRRAGQPRVTVARGEREFEVRIAKTAGEASGMVMSYDFDPVLARKTYHQTLAGGFLLLTSVLAAPMLAAALTCCWAESEGLINPPLQDLEEAIAYLQQRDIYLQVVSNNLLGGNIGCAGLLTVSDLLAGYQQFQIRHPQVKLRQVLVPDAAFDHHGEDLCGRGFWDLEAAIGKPVRPF